MRRAFIFTMDAIIALVPVFIILASVSTPSIAQSLAFQGQTLGDVRKGTDILESMYLGDAFDTANESVMNETLKSLIPSSLGYNFTMSYDLNGTEVLQIFNLTRGNLTGADGVTAARRMDLYWTQEIIDDVHKISHKAFNESTPCASSSPANATYNMSFYVTAEDVAGYDYYLVTDKVEGQDAWVQTCDTPFCGASFSSCDDIVKANGYKFDGNVLEDRSKYNFSTNNSLYADSVNYVYVTIDGDPGKYADFYVIRAVKSLDESFVDPETARKPQVVFLSLDVWRN